MKKLAERLALALVGASVITGAVTAFVGGPALILYTIINGI